ncbi:MAG: DUF177 domain-containing protein [Pseudomonadota bacterium]
MAETDKTATDAAEPLPITHEVAVTTLAEAGGLSFDLEPTAQERTAIAAFLAIDGLEALRLRGKILPEGEGWRIEAILTALPVQSCVVTLEPVRNPIEAEVERRYQPGVIAPEGAEIEMGADDDRAPEPLGPAIDLAAAMIETLALSLDPFPRKDGAAHGTVVYAPPGSEPLTDEAARPFAGLAALKARLSDGEH